MKSELGGGARAAWWAALFGASVLAGVAVLDTSGAAADRNRDGYTHGYTHRYAHGFTHGYAHGYTRGYTRGYTHGYTDGYTDGDTESQSYSLPFGETEAKLEADFQKIPNAQQAESHLKAITASPHMAGTEGSHKVAEWLRDQYRKLRIRREDRDLQRVDAAAEGNQAGTGGAREEGAGDARAALCGGQGFAE